MTLLIKREREQFSLTPLFMHLLTHLIAHYRLPTQITIIQRNGRPFLCSIFHASAHSLTHPTQTLLMHSLDYTDSLTYSPHPNITHSLAYTDSLTRIFFLYMYTYFLFLLISVMIWRTL